jgi:hypothetical protein
MKRPTLTRTEILWATLAGTATVFGESPTPGSQTEPPKRT